MEQIKCYFLLFMFMFLCGLIVHLIVPIELVLFGGLKIESAYNTQKIMSEHQILRATASLKSPLLTRKIQLSSYLMQWMKRSMEEQSIYETLNLKSVKLNNAYVIANLTEQQFSRINVNVSMVYILNYDTNQQMTRDQKFVYDQLLKIQPYLQSFGLRYSPMYRTINILEVFAKYRNVEAYFSNPTYKIGKFPIQDFHHYFEETFLNFQLQNKTQSIFMISENFRVCIPVFLHGQPFAVICQYTNNLYASQLLVSIMQIPDFNLSDSEYFMIRPLFARENATHPIIMTNFSTRNLSNISAGENISFDYFDPQTTQNIFKGNAQTQMSTFMLDSAKTCFVFPLILSSSPHKQVAAYMVVLNDFQKADLTNRTRFNQFILVLVVPSIIMLIISSILTFMLLRPKFLQLQQQTDTLRQYCLFIRRGDLGLEVQGEGQGEFGNVLREIRGLNQLSKFSCVGYMNVNVHERVIRLFRALNVFQDFGLALTYVYLNLSFCYKEIGDLETSLTFIQKSRQCFGLEKQIQKIQDIDCSTFKVQESSSLKDQERNGWKIANKKIKQKIQRIFFLLFFQTHTLFYLHRQDIVKIMSNHEKILKIVNNNRIMSNFSRFLRQNYHTELFYIEIAFCQILEMLCKIKDGVFIQNINQKMDNIHEIILKEEEKLLRYSKRELNYQKNNKINEKQFERMIPLDIMKSYWHFLKAQVMMKQQQFISGYENFILALDGNHFDPFLHKEIKQQIYNVMDFFSIQDNGTQEIFKYLDNKKKKRDFYFVFDTSNPQMEKKDINKWKNQVRSISSKILQQLINDDDRLCIFKFSKEVKTVCNLISKKNNKMTLKKQLLNSAKTTALPFYSNFEESLAKIVERSKSFNNQKREMDYERVYIFFLKNGKISKKQHICRSVKKNDKSIFIFLVYNEENTQKLNKKSCKRVQNCGEGYYVVDLRDFQSLQIIFEHQENSTWKQSLFQ